MFLVTLALLETRLLITMERNFQQRIMIMMTGSTIVRLNILVLGGTVTVICAIPMVSTATTHMEKESTGRLGKVTITPSNLSSSRYVDPDNISSYVNFTVRAYIQTTNDISVISICNHVLVCPFLWFVEVVDTVLLVLLHDSQCLQGRLFV